MRETEEHDRSGENASTTPAHGAAAVGPISDTPLRSAEPEQRDAAGNMSPATQSAVDDESIAVHVHFDLAALRDPDVDPEAYQREWRRLVEHFAPRLDSYFHLKVPTPDDRDDLIQHIVVKAVVNVHRVQASAALWNWLRKIGDNRLIDLRRSAQAAARHLEQHAAELRAETEFVHVAGLSDARLDPAHRDGELGRRIAALSMVDRQLLDLVANQVPHEEIAERLGLPSADASRQRWSRLRRRLREP